MDLSWSAAILVGGRARRLDGRAKPRLAIGGRTVLDRQVAALGALGAVPTLVAVDPAAYADCGLRAIADRVDAGALGGLYTALAEARTAWVVVLAGDMPFITPTVLRHLLDARDDHDAVVPRTGTLWHPLCAVYATSTAPALQASIASGVRRIGDVIAGLRVRAVDPSALAAIDPAGLALTNVNTPDDLRQARADARHGR